MSFRIPFSKFGSSRPILQLIFELRQPGEQRKESLSLRGAFLFVVLDQPFEFLPLLLHLNVHDASDVAIWINALMTLNLLTHASFNVPSYGGQELFGGHRHSCNLAWRPTILIEEKIDR